MAAHDVIGDMLTKIRNASNAGLKKVIFPYSKIKHSISEILIQEGFLEKAQIVGSEKKRLIEVYLRYYNEKPVISGLKRISKPGRRVYRGSNDIPRFMNGLAVTIVSTSKGLLTGKDAQEQKTGGEVICYVW
jgi:small subunit ribosomal protein S8